MLRQHNEALQAELAALKAENKRLKPRPGHYCYWTDYGERQKQRAEQAEAELAALIPVAGACPECGIDPEELAALKGRRCETCASADSMVDPHNPTHIYVCTNEDSVCFECWLVRDSDFACNRWTARAEEGGES
jgi:hypothetical protein